MLSENIYTLLRQSSLSQEQLAEKLGVSRQTVSKWEGGLSVPELEKLCALCECFGVSLDELTSDTAPDPANREDAPARGHPAKRTETVLGLVLCFAGVIALVITGLAAVLSPRAAEQMNESSAVTINGTGVLFIACIAAMAIGLYLIVRRK